MTILVALVSVAAFLGAFVALRLVPVALAATHTAQSAMAAMRDPALDDLAREKAMQQASVSLFKAFGSILIRFVLTLIAAAIPVYGADLLGLVSADAVIGWLSRWDVIIGLSVIMIAAWVLKARLWPST